MRSETPRELGFRMPAEWEPHEATWIAWPHNRSDWPGRFAPIPWVYAEIVKRLTAVEKVRILAADEEVEHAARRVLEKAGVEIGAVEFFRQPTNRSWTRDYGPIFIKDVYGEVAATNWKFNAWAKYDDWQKDDAVPQALARRLKMRCWSPRMVLEGGSIDVNGAGALLTNRECLLSPIQERNPGLDRKQMERKLADYLGIDRFLWVINGIAGDDTHGHIDDIARFVDRDTIAIAYEQDPADVNYQALRDNWRFLRGKGFRLVKLPMPAPVVFNGRRLPASYANFYIANRLVMVPTFNDRNDRVALNILAKLFPDREVVGIHSVELVWGLGTLHCMTQQQPAGYAGLAKGAQI